MAVATTDVRIKPSQGWVLVATNPVFLCIKPSAFTVWTIAVTAGGLPATTLRGLQMGRGIDDRQAFQTGAITGEIYIRVDIPASSMSSEDPVHFGVIAA